MNLKYIPKEYVDGCVGRAPSSSGALAQEHQEKPSQLANTKPGLARSSEV